MKIYFCDECNESIPLKEIKTNEITIDAGKIYCARCAPKPARSRGGVGLPTMIVGGLLCISVGAVLMALWGEPLFARANGESLGDAVARVESSSNERFAAMESKLKAIDDDLEEAPDASSGRSGKLASAKEAISANEEGIRNLRRRIESSGEELVSKHSAFETRNLETIRRLMSDAEDMRNLDEQLVSDLATLHEKLDKILEQVRGAEGRISVLETSEGRPATNTPPVTDSGKKPDAGAPPVIEEDPALREAVDKAVELLADPKAEKRFQAVFELAELKSRRAEEALVGAMEDKVDYVRSAALSSLADMGARWAIPHIIDKLADDEDYVREQAISCLERLMGRSIGLDPGDSADKRSAKMRELKKWWKDEGEAAAAS